MAGELGFDTGPYVALAVFCDRVLEEKDGTLTLVRVIDTLSVQVRGPDAPDDIPPGVVQTTLVLSFRAGQARGGQRLRMSLERPDGSTMKSPEVSINFPPGESSGVNVILPTAIEVISAGIYWNDVFLQDRLVTRVPLRITYDFTR